jgi:hypothetical protein
MLTQDQVLQIKSRLLLCGQIGSLLCKQENGEPIQLTVEKYEQSMNCLAMLDGDVRSLFSDYDVLRGMITGDFNLIQKDTEDSGEKLVGQGDSEASADKQDADAQPTDGDNGKAGASQKRKARPAATRNKRGSRKKKGELDTAAVEQPVDSSK